ncbi:hypothetical protein ACWGCP_26615 [Streptomyces niveus]
MSAVRACPPPKVPVEVAKKTVMLFSASTSAWPTRRPAITPARALVRERSSSQLGTDSAARL